MGRLGNIYRDAKSSGLRSRACCTSTLRASTFVTEDTPVAGWHHIFCKKDVRSVCFHAELEDDQIKVGSVAFVPPLLINRHDLVVVLI